jgi:putative transposase
MARLARVVVPGIPHHVTQRGNRRQKTFFCAGDYHRYRATLSLAKHRWNVGVWAYCLMPNHVHLVLVPSSRESLSRAVGELHQKYTRAVNKREGWTGCLWQGRYFSFPMDEEYLLRAVRYVLLNPVRAGLVEKAADWPYSSVRSHLEGRRDGVVDPGPLRERVSDWDGLLQADLPSDECEELRLHQRTGRPLGTEAFVRRLEALLGRSLASRRKAGRPSRL